MVDVKLTNAQEAMLWELDRAGDGGMVVPGTRGSTAKALREHSLVEYVDRKATPPRQRATESGRRWLVGRLPPAAH